MSDYGSLTVDLQLGSSKFFSDLDTVETKLKQVAATGKIDAKITLKADTSDANKKVKDTNTNILILGDSAQKTGEKADKMSGLFYRGHMRAAKATRDQTEAAAELDKKINQIFNVVDAKGVQAFKALGQSADEAFAKGIRQGDALQRKIDQIFSTADAKGVKDMEALGAATDEAFRKGVAEGENLRQKIEQIFHTADAKLLTQQLEEVDAIFKRLEADADRVSRGVRDAISADLKVSLSQRAVSPVIGQSNALGLLSAQGAGVRGLERDAIAAGDAASSGRNRLADIAPLIAVRNQALEASAAQDKLANTTAKTDSVFEKFGKRAVQFAAGIVLYRAFSLVTGTIESAIKTGIAFDAEMETRSIALAQALHGTRAEADALLGTIQKFAAHTPDPFVEWIPQFQKLAAAKQPLTDIERELKAIGDASFAVGKGREGVDAVTSSLVKMQAQGYLGGRGLMALRNIGIDVTQALVDAYQNQLPKGTNAAQRAFVEGLLKKGMIPVRDGMRAISAWIERDPFKAGQMESQSHTFTASVSRMTDALKIMLGQGLKPVFDETEKLLFKSDELGKNKGLRTWIDNAGSGMADLIRGADGAATSFNRLADSATNIGKAIEAIKFFSFETRWEELKQAINAAMDRWDAMRADQAQRIRGDVIPGVSDGRMSSGGQSTGSALGSGLDAHESSRGQAAGIGFNYRIQESPLKGDKSAKDKSVAGVPAYYKLMEAHLNERTADFTGKMYECGESITYFMHKVGIASATASSLAAKMNIRPDDKGHYPIGTVLHLDKARGKGFSTRHYGLAGRINPDGTQEFLESTAASAGQMNAAGYHIHGNRTVEQISGRIIGSGRPGGAGQDWKGDIALHDAELRSEKQQEAAAKRHEAAEKRAIREHDAAIRRQLALNALTDKYNDLLQDVYKTWMGVDPPTYLDAQDRLNNRMDARRAKIEEESRQRMKQFDREGFIDEHSGLSKERAGQYAGISKTYATTRQQLLDQNASPQEASDAARAAAMAETRELQAKWDLEDKLERKRRDLLEVTKEENAEYKLSALFLQNGNKVIVRRAKDLSDLGKALAAASKDERDFAKATIATATAQQKLIDKGVAADVRADRLFDDSWITKGQKDAEHQAKFQDAMGTYTDEISIFQEGGSSENKGLDKEMVRLKHQWKKDKFTDSEIQDLLAVATWEKELERVERKHQEAAASVKGTFDDVFSHMDGGIHGMLTTLETDVTRTLQNIAIQVAEDYTMRKLFGLTANDSGGYNGGGGGLLGGGIIGQILGVGGGGPTLGYDPGMSAGDPSGGVSGVFGTGNNPFANSVAHHYGHTIHVTVNGGGDAATIKRHVRDGINEALNGAGSHSSQMTNQSRTRKGLGVA